MHPNFHVFHRITAGWLSMDNIITIDSPTTSNITLINTQTLKTNATVRFKPIEINNSMMDC